MPEELFDTDKLHLTKEQIMIIGDRLIAGWNRVRRPGYQRMVLIARFGKWYVGRLRREEAEQYYNDFLKEVFAVMHENALTGDPALAMLKRMHDKEEPQAHTELPTQELDFSLKTLLKHGAMRDD